MNRLTGYLGTYASPQSLGIYRFTIGLDDGSLSLPQLYCHTPDCKYLSLEGTCLASSVKRGDQAGICLLDTAGDAAALTGESFHERAAACYVTQDSGRLYTANYHEGTVLVYMKTGLGPQLIRRIDIAPGAGCHQVLFHGPYMLVPCLLLDSVKIFDSRDDFSPAGELTFAKGTGPRHGIFDQSHSRLFLVSELSNQVFVYQTCSSSGPQPRACLKIHSRHLQLESVSPIPAHGQEHGQPPASAALRLSPDERFLYVSTRFTDIITVFAIHGCRLELIQQTSSGGIHPRDFILTPEGDFLLAVNRTKGGLVCFRRDPGSGRILELCSRVPAPEAVSIVLEPAVGRTAHI